MKDELLIAALKLILSYMLNDIEGKSSYNYDNIADLANIIEAMEKEVKGEVKSEASNHI